MIQLVDLRKKSGEDGFILIAIMLDGAKQQIIQKQE
jgi:hypothetical protein